VSFLNSLDDGREVWIYGERIKNIAAHPAFRNSARIVAAQARQRIVVDGCDPGILLRRIAAWSWPSDRFSPDREYQASTAEIT
jgi:hypothetical protein